MDMLLLLQRVWPPRAPLSKARPKMPVTMNVKGGSGSTTPRRSSTGGAPPTHADFIKLQAELLKLRIENEQLREENRHLREERTSTNRRHCGSGSGSSNGQLIVGNAKATGASDAIFFAGAPAAAAADKSSAQGEKRKSWMKKRRSSKAEAETAESVQGDDAVDEGGAEEEKQGEAGENGEEEEEEAEFFLVRFGGKHEEEPTQSAVDGQIGGEGQDSVWAMPMTEEPNNAPDAPLHSARGRRSLAKNEDAAPAKEVIRVLTLTKEQQAAAAAAEVAQRVLWEEAEGAPEKMKLKVGQYWGSHCGGPAIEKLFDKGAELVDAQYLIALAEAGGVLPRWQALPEVAKVGTDHMWRLRCWNDPYRLPVLVLSCPWLDGYHPDRLGEQLKRLAPIMRAMVEETKKYSPYGTVVRARLELKTCATLSPWSPTVLLFRSLISLRAPGRALGLLLSPTAALWRRVG